MLAMLPVVLLATAGRADDGWLVFRHGDERTAVSADGKSVIDLAPDPRPGYDADTVRELRLGRDPQPRFVTSPDGSGLAYLGRVVNGRAAPHPFFGQVCVCKPDGSAARVVVAEPANRQSLSWSPDGAQLAFDEDTPTNGDGDAAGRAPRSLRQVHVIDTATGVRRRTFAGTTSISRPQYTPKGNLLYFQYRDRQGKFALEDLYFQKLGPTPEDEHRLSRALVRREFLVGAALSPDESKLAYAAVGRMTVLPLDGSAEQTWTVADVGKQLGIEWSIFFAAPVWRSDGQALACRCGFLGGRQAGDDTPVKGEEQVVVFRLGEAARAFTFAPRWTLEGWRSAAEVGRLKR